MAEDEENKRPMVAAAQKGPAPNAYGLPPLVGYDNHDVTKHRMPAYTMRKALKRAVWRLGPGPKYAFQRNLTRYGPNGTPQYSMAKKIRPLPRLNVPGPPAYMTEEVPPMRTDRAPAYSLGDRTKLRSEDFNPAPNIYVMPEYLGPSQPIKTSAPAYTMASRAKPLRPDIGPGPARYPAVDMSVSRKRPPVYSVVGRNYPPGDRGMNPGPGAYLPEYNRAKNPPSFSFGVKHSPYKRTPMVEADNEV
ncbi:outer dense fiber protein 3-like [Schistocerca cancellata]|uniref:outer dense fiber protein 3-like n=1 Tax=Schistocerca cancellata TaxID=274614 RepID=UPI0021197D1F|nr:outer dense fiber protein 3-like [Schistocerca cancellata]